MLDYELNIQSESQWIIATPTSIAKQFPFYLLECGLFIAESKYFTHRSGMEMFLLMETMSGEGELLYNGDTFALVPNSVIMFSCMEEHVYRTKSAEPWVFRWIQFSGCVSDLYALLLYPEKMTVYNDINPADLKPIFDQICKYATRNDGYGNARMSSFITQYLTEVLCRRFSGGRACAQIEQKITEVCGYMKNNVSRKISIDELASMIYVSKYYFLRVFKSIIGSSPHEFLINLRINKAKELLLNTNYTLDTIASEVGFSDSRSLIMSFKKGTGVSPGKYRSYYRNM